jgi:PPOX class probable FMN-dependent enzyme
MTIPWLSILRDALDLEYADRPRIATLATIDIDHPRARTVILRRIDDDGTLWIVSDAHSNKNAQLRRTPHAELVLYLPTSREQFRLFGHTKVIGRGDDEPFRQQFWLTLTDVARASFFWPTIGKPYNECDPVATATPADTPMPDSFEPIAIHPEVVEHLTTADIPHRRTRWRKENAWQPQRINP